MLWYGESCGSHRQLEPANFFNQGIQYSRVLPGPQVWRFINPAGKQVVVICQCRLLDPFNNCFAGQRRNFKLNRLHSLLLHAVRSEIEESKFPCAVAQLQSNGPLFGACWPWRRLQEKASFLVQFFNALYAVSSTNRGARSYKFSSGHLKSSTRSKVAVIGTKTV